MERKEIPLAEQISQIQEDVKSLAKTLKISPELALKLLSHRELVIINSQLATLRDLLYAEKAKAKRRGRR